MVFKMGTKGVGYYPDSSQHITQAQKANDANNQTAVGQGALMTPSPPSAPPKRAKAASMKRPGEAKWFGTQKPVKSEEERRAEEEAAAAASKAAAARVAQRRRQQRSQQASTKVAEDIGEKSMRDDRLRKFVDPNHETKDKIWNKSDEAPRQQHALAAVKDTSPSAHQSDSNDTARPNAAATNIQATYRGSQARKVLRVRNEAARSIQAGFRGRQTRKEMQPSSLADSSGAEGPPQLPTR